MHRITPIIKPVGDFCNLECTYCFYNAHDQDLFHLMAPVVLEKFIREHLSLAVGAVDFIWHGGEPLLAGIEFYESVVALQRQWARAGQTISNHIQTNATLVDDRWAEFFGSHHFQIGVSLDGDRESHNGCRVDKGGRGTFDRVRHGISVLERHHIRFGVIQVLTRHNLPNQDADFRFFVDRLGLRKWSVNVVADTSGCDPGRALGPSNSELDGAMQRYIALWMARNDDELKIRDIDDLVCAALGKRSGHCAYSGTCAGYYCLNWDGRVFPCDSLTTVPSLCLGDLVQQPLEEILSGSRRRDYLMAIRSLPEDCNACEWLRCCHNGCPAQRVGGIGGKYRFCDARRSLFNRAASLVKIHREAQDSSNMEVS